VNRFSGFILVSFSGFVSLETMSLRGNRLNDTMAEEVMGLKNLRVLERELLFKIYHHVILQYSFEIWQIH